MTKKESIMAAISHREGDRVPKGELSISGRLANQLLGKSYPLDYQHFERDKEIRELLNIDIVNLGDWPAEEVGKDMEGNTIFRTVYGDEYVCGSKSKHMTKPALVDIHEAKNYPIPNVKKCSAEIIANFTRKTDFFVMGQVAGPVTSIDEMLGMEDFMVYCLTDTKDMAILCEKIMEYEVNKARLFLDNGADAIIIADDIAFNTGTFLPPHIMDELAFPFYKIAVKEIKKHKDVPIFFHSDGNINRVLDKIVDSGFNGLQSIQPSAGMDIAQVKKDYGDVLCLMGNIDLDYVMTFATSEEVSDTVKRTIDIAAPGGGYILSTCNTLVDAIPPQNALAMYAIANEYVVNKK